MVKQTGQKPIAQNRKARHDYHIDDVVEAGLVLTGTEVKSLRLGRASLVDAFAAVRGNELWLQNLHIPEYKHGTWTNHEPRRTRKLLLHKDEMQKLIRAVEQQGVSLIPLSLYFKDGYAKV
ncbi:MAG: SsrA-binding protein, partial [Kribbellaceae bacterium]|nr:SsrA-binding protein [Kribbellaceae bacterium]